MYPGWPRITPVETVANLGAFTRRGGRVGGGVIRDEVIAFMREGKRAEAGAITRTKGAQQVALVETKMQELASFSSPRPRSSTGTPLPSGTKR